MTRCEVAVPAGTYREPGRCTKTANVKTVQIKDMRVKMCRHHRTMVENGKTPVRSKS